MLKVDIYKTRILLVYIIGLFLFITISYVSFLGDNDALVNVIYNRTSSVKDEKMDEIYNEFGEENVVFYETSFFHDGETEAVVVFTDNNFIDVGVYGTNYDTHTSVIHDIDLLSGDVWENDDSTEVVVDEYTAENLFGGIDNAVGKEITLETYTFTIVGVVEDNLDRRSNGLSDNSMIYLPLDYRYTRINNRHTGVNFTIKVDAFQVQSSRNRLYDLFQGTKEEYPNFVLTYRHVLDDATPFYSLVAWFTFLYVVLLAPLLLILRYMYQNRINVITYDDTYKSKVVMLKLKEGQESFVRTPKEIVDYHLFGDDETLLYMAMKKNEVLGLCCIRKDDTNNNYFIRYLIIGDKYQGNHVGKKFIRNTLKVIPNEIWVTTTVKENNVVAKSFFEDLKFNEFSREEDEINLQYGTK